MLATLTPAERASASALTSTQDLVSSPEVAFALICEVENWPNWLSFLTTARRIDEGSPLRLGSEIALRSAIPGEREELYEVDQLLDGHIVSLVGAYSVRRRLDFRIERKGSRARLVVRVDYPAYGGVVGAFLDRLTSRPRLERALDASLVHFKSLVEFRDVEKDELLADF